MKMIKVTIKNGAATIAPTGFAGPACQKATADLEAAMGATTQSIPTGEMRQTTATLKVGAGS